jgi:hypothetical protein
MKVYQFSWCVCSFDQQCNIKASNKKKAKEIFKKEVIGEDTTWAANHAHCWCLNDTYKKAYLDKLTIHYSE